MKKCFYFLDEFVKIKKKSFQYRKPIAFMIKKKKRNSDNKISEYTYGYLLAHHP